MLRLAIPLAAICAFVACSGQNEQAEPPTLAEPPISAVESFSKAEQLAEGETIAEQLCASCHAIGKTGESPHTDAPPFHTLSARFPLETLAEPLAEGIMVGHPDMPEFQFEAQHVDALITYLESVQPDAD